MQLAATPDVKKCIWNAYVSDNANAQLYSSSTLGSGRSLVV